MVELAEDAPKLRLVRVVSSDPDGSEPVEDPELFLPKSLGDDERVRIALHPRRLDDEVRGVTRAQIRRCQHDVGAFLDRKHSEPATDSDRLSLPEIGQWDIDVADVDVDLGVASLQCRIARHVSRGLTVANDVEQVGPDLL